MNAAAFLEQHGKEVATRVAKLAGTNWAYFSQIATGNRRPSPELAVKLVSASAGVVRKPAHQLDFVSLLMPQGKKAA